MNCKSCDQETSPNENCRKCEEPQATSIVAPTPDGIVFTGKELDFLCPFCPDQNLQVATINNNQVCGCSFCQGFLIDSVSLGFMINVLRLEYNGADDKPVLIDTRELDKVMNCPACFGAMYTHPYHGPGNVVINSCSECQLNWLDAGELAKIVRAPGKRGS